jgi:3-phosphoshikimate 1-carboxyvinyltransferase
MPTSIAITPRGPLAARVRPPGSKSITNRALICAALAEGDSLLRGALDSDDTRVMIEALRRLGVGLEVRPAEGIIRVNGVAGQFSTTDVLELHVGNSGTTMRFLAAMLCLGQGDFRLDGNQRMRQRPIADLLSALTQLGAHIESELGNGCPPVRVVASGLPGGHATIRGDLSSQFLSGLLMAAPYARTPVRLTVVGRLVSQPYIAMTLRLMAAFGINALQLDDWQFVVPLGHYRGQEYAIEPDASAASYFLAAAAIAGGCVTVEGLSRDSLQGDVAFADVLQRMGCQVEWGAEGVTVRGGSLQGIEVDMNAISDTVPTLAAVALFARGPTTIAGVAHIRHKESDRIRDLAVELRKLGAMVHERSEGLQIVPGTLHGAAIDTYDDHRMAMSLALVGLRVKGVVINDPGCTAKTYPEFFKDLAALEGQAP